MFDFLQNENNLSLSNLISSSSSFMSNQINEVINITTIKINDIIILKKNSFNNSNSPSSTNEIENEELFDSNLVTSLSTTTSSSNSSSNSSLRTIKSNYNCFDNLPIEILSLISSYLTAEELCKFAQVNKFTLLAFQRLIKETSNYWSNEVMRRYLSSSILTVSTIKNKSIIHNLSYLNYLQLNVIESETEFRHFQSLENHYQAIYLYNQKTSLSRNFNNLLGNITNNITNNNNTNNNNNNNNNNNGIIGLVCDIAWTDSPLLSAVLSKKRYMTMSTILTNSIGDVHKFKKVIQCDNIRSFLPIRSTTPASIDMDLVRVQADDLVYPGFIGYAVNLIRLPEEYESLRYTVFWGLFRDLMVFDNRTSSELYARNLSPEEMVKYWVVTLEDYSEEVLKDVYPRLSTKVQRKKYFEEPNETIKQRLESKVDNAIISYSIARCTY